MAGLSRAVKCVFHNEEAQPQNCHRELNSLSGDSCPGGFSSHPQIFGAHGFIPGMETPASPNSYLTEEL